MDRTETTRRDFLKTSAGAAAAGAVTPYIFTTSQARAQSANDKLNMAAIGVGGRGTGIGHQAGHYGNMLCCADVYRKNAENFAGKYDGKCEIYEDYHKILERDDIDAITCGTPDHWHVKIAIDAMRAGKDVYCEKPLTLTMKEGQQVCQAAKETGRVFQVGTQQRSECGDMFLKAVVIAQSGRLGDKLHALSSVGGATSGGPFDNVDPPGDFNWDFWLGQTPNVPFCSKRVGWDFRWWLEYSGGQVTDWGVHHSDIGVWALGGAETGVVEATPVEGQCNFPLGRELMRDTLLGKKPFEDLPVTYNVANKFRVDMKLPNGNELTLFSGGNELIISGEKGKIRVNRGSLTGKPVDEIENSPADKAWLAEEVDKLYGGPRQGHMKNFFNAVKSREKPISDVWTHCNSVNSCHMANISMLLNRTVKFDPQKYAFTGDDEATQLMSRKQRAEYAIEV